MAEDNKLSDRVRPSLPRGRRGDTWYIKALSVNEAHDLADEIADLEKRLAEAEEENDKLENMLDGYDAKAIEMMESMGIEMLPGIAWCESLDFFLSTVAVELKDGLQEMRELWLDAVDKANPR